jgi:hypothetical protein
VDDGNRDVGAMVETQDIKDVASTTSGYAPGPHPGFTH